MRLCRDMGVATTSKFEHISTISDTTRKCERIRHNNAVYIYI